MRWIRTWLARLSNWQRAILFLFLALSTGLSAWMVIAYSRAPAGYAAAYANGGAFVFAGIFALAGLVLLPWRQTRCFGLMSLGSAVWLMGSYASVASLLYRFDLVAWKGEHLVSLLPEQGGYYIYFQQGTSDVQIENFSDRVLHEPPSVRGQGLKPGIRSYARLTPADGRQVIAIGLQSDLTLKQRRDLRLRIQSDQIVAEVSEVPQPSHR
jgi:hypothetical protein